MYEKLFTKNDEFLKAAQIILWALIAVCAICVVIGVYLLIKADEIFIGIMTLILGLFGDYCLWIFGNLLFSYLKDIKFIRNKLYNLDECNIDLMKEEESSEKTVKSDDTKNSEQTIETK